MVPDNLRPTLNSYNKSTFLSINVQILIKLHSLPGLTICGSCEIQSAESLVRAVEQFGIQAVTLEDYSTQSIYLTVVASATGRSELGACVDN